MISWGCQGNEVNLPRPMVSKQARPYSRWQGRGAGTGRRHAPTRPIEEVIGQQLYLVIARFSLHLHPASTPLRRVSFTDLLQQYTLFLLFWVWMQWEITVSTLLHC